MRDQAGVEGVTQPGMTNARCVALVRIKEGCYCSWYSHPSSRLEVPSPEVLKPTAQSPLRPMPSSLPRPGATWTRCWRWSPAPRWPASLPGPMSTGRPPRPGGTSSTSPRTPAATTSQSATARAVLEWRA